MIKRFRFSQAERLLSGLIALEIQVSRVFRLYSELLWLKGDLFSALKNAEIAVHLAPKDAQAELNLAQLYFATGKIKSLRSMASGIEGPRREPILSLLESRTRRFSLTVDTDGLIKLFETSFLNNGYLAAFRLAEMLLNIRVPCGCQITSVLSAPVTRRSVLYPSGMLASRIKALYRAVVPPGLKHWKHYYLTYLANAPSMPGVASWETLRAEAAGEWRKVRPRNLARYGWMLKESGKYFLSYPPDYGRARACFLAARQSPPPNFDIFGKLAEIELCRGRQTAAFRWFDEAFKVSPDHESDILAWRGELKSFIGDYAAALCDLNAAVEGKAYYALTWRAIARMKLGNLDSALEDAKAAVAFNRLDGEARVIMGEILRLKGDFARAGKELVSVLSGQFPYRHELWAGLNMILLRLETGGMRAAAVYRRGVMDELRCCGATKACADISMAGASPLRLQRVISVLFESSRGCRRDEPYLFPLWIK